MRNPSRLALTVTLSYTLACGGGAVDEDAGYHFGSELCVQKDGVNCGAPATTFAPDSPVLYLVHRTKDMPKLHQIYNIDWVAVDAGEAVPAGTVLANVQVPVEDEGSLAASTNWTVESELTPPGGVWPPGSFKVVVTLDGAPVSDVPFTIR